MKNLDLNKYGVQAMNTNEMKRIDGGIKILIIRGLLDGIKGNTEIYLFGFRIY